jgi:magnesium transporter
LLASDREAFADIYFDALQILDTLKIQREMIMNIFNIQSIISSNQMNWFMKKLTALALIIMIPTLISGIYGMNVDNLPFADQGFWFVIVVMFFVTGMLFFMFKKFDWL